MRRTVIGRSSLRARLGMLGAVAAGASMLAQGALGHTSQIQTSIALPSSAASRQDPLEVLAGQIASHIAGRSVTVNCDGAREWAGIVGTAGGNPNSESGLVTTSWNGTTGQLLAISDVAQLAPTICRSLTAFVLAATKPIECAAAPEPRLLLALDDQAAAGTSASAATTRAAPGRDSPPSEPCSLGSGKATAMDAAQPSSYTDDAIAILTLAHESVHLGGIVGGQLTNGLTVGDPQAEAKADCFGMQWMPYVAERLGDNAVAAQAIANYFWKTIYPIVRSSQPRYASPGCRPNGPLDARPTKATPWP